MNKYFGTGSHRSSKIDYQKNITLGSIRSAILRGKSMCLGTSHPEKWHEIIRKEFPDVSLRMEKAAVFINEQGNVK